MRKDADAPPSGGSDAAADLRWSWWVPHLGWLLICVSSGFAGFFLTLAALPLWAVHNGASVGSAGLVTTVMLAATVASQTAVPAVIRAIGPVSSLMVGLLLLGAVTPLYLLSGALWWLLALSAVRGIGFAFVTVVSIALLAQFVPAGLRSRAIGIHGLAVNIPNLIAVPLGVYLAGSGHFTLLAWLAAIPALAVVTAKPLQRLARQTDPAAGTANARALGGPARGAYAPAAVLFAICVSAVAVITYLPIEGPSSDWAAVAIFVFGLTATFARWRLGVVADRFGLSLVLPVTVVFMAVGMVVFGISLDVGEHQFAIVSIIGGALCGVGYGGVQSLTLVSALGRVPRSAVAHASAIWNIAFDTGLGGGALVVGLLAGGGIDMGVVFCLVAIASLGTLWLARNRSEPLPVGTR